MNYYQQKLFLAKVDNSDNIIGKIERWEAHKEGVLHRGFTAILTYQNDIVLQHRKHPAFDGYFDLTFSSHQVYKNNHLQTDLEAIYDTLKREWYINTDDLIEKPKYLGKFYYSAKDSQSVFTEHEIDYIYQAELKNLPTPNSDYAYGFKLINKSRIKNLKLKIKDFKIAPWIKEMIKEKFFVI